MKLKITPAHTAERQLKGIVAATANVAIGKISAETLQAYMSIIKMLTVCEIHNGSGRCIQFKFDKSDFFFAQIIDQAPAAGNLHQPGKFAAGNGVIPENMIGGHGLSK